MLIQRVCKQTCYVQFIIMDLLNNLKFRFDGGVFYALYSNNLLKFCCNMDVYEMSLVNTYGLCEDLIYIYFDRVNEQVYALKYI